MLSGFIFSTIMSLHLLNPHSIGSDKPLNKLIDSDISASQAGVILVAGTAVKCKERCKKRRRKIRLRDKRRARKAEAELRRIARLNKSNAIPLANPIVNETIADNGGSDDTGTKGAICTKTTSYDAADFDRVLENFEQTETLHLSGPEWDNTLVRNCRIHDTGSDGIFIKNVRNVVVTQCEVYNTEGEGIKTSSSGGTEDVTIDGNYIHDTASQAIHSPQRFASDVDHTNLRILNNTIENVGSHSIYIQSQDFLIAGNVIQGSRKSNGISVRSSGEVRCNSVSGVSTSGKPALRYFSDHQTGLSDTLLIENNDFQNEGGVGVDIYSTVERYDGQTGTDHVVQSFVIRNNNIDAQESVMIDGDYDNPVFDVRVYDNAETNF